MLLAFNFFLVLFFLPGVPAPGDVPKEKVKQVLTDDEIRAILECHENKEDKRTEEYWRKQYPALGELALPVTRLALQEVADSCGAVAGGWIVSLAAHCAPLLYQCLVLTKEDIKAKRTPAPLVVVFNPKENIGNADHKECIKILQELQKLGVEVSKFTNPNKEGEESELTHHFNFANSLSVEDVIRIMKDVNFLVISLCGVSVGNEEKKFIDDHQEVIKSSGRKSCTDTLRVALSILGTVTKNPKVVLTLCSGNGRADDGTYPFDNEHRITHQPTQYWPMGELAVDKSKTRSFILNSPFLNFALKDGADNKLEDKVLNLAREAKSKIKGKIEHLKSIEFFEDKGYVEAEPEAANATSTQEDAIVELTVNNN